MSRFTFLTINFLLFHTCWMATAYGASQGWSWLGPAFVFPALVIHVFLLGERIREVMFLALAALLGYCIESSLYALGVFEYAYHSADLVLAPFWSFTLWLIFATLFHGALYWIRGRVIVQCVAGVVLGPFSYYSASALNVITFTWPDNSALLLLSVVWGILIPALSYLAYNVSAFSSIRIDSFDRVSRIGNRT